MEVHRGQQHVSPSAECGIVTGDVHSVADLVPDGGAASSSSKTSRPLGQQRFVPTADRRTLVLSGPELPALGEAQWDAVAQYEEVVFARTTPEQKLRIVRALRARAFVVGMTGDGVNDAPSLRAADVVLLDDSFAGLVDALRCGRMMFDNLRKTLAYLLPAGSFSEFWPVITNVVLGIPQILSSFLMIIVCLFTDPAAAVALADEAPEADVLLRPPRLPGTDRLETLSSFAMAYWYLQRSGIPFFGAIWFRFGVLPDGIDPTVYAAKLNVASSIYFVNLVVM